MSGNRATLLKNFFLTGHYCLNAFKIKRRHRQKYRNKGDANHHEYVREIQKKGYFVIQDYYSPEQCSLLCNEIDRLLEQHASHVQKDNLNSDNRIFGAERASSEIHKFHSDSFLQSVGESYHETSLINHTTLAGRIRAVTGNLGSGQGWHRDAFRTQYKSMVYLTDVDDENGPFQIIESSHRTLPLLRDTFNGNLAAPPNSRITEEQVDRIIKKSPSRLTTIKGKRGTVILVDTRAIHRGMPIQRGIRYALTNYYYAPYQVTDELVNNFAAYQIDDARSKSAQ